MAKDDLSNHERLIQRLCERLEISPEELFELLPSLEHLDLPQLDSLDVEEMALELEEEFRDELGR